MKCSVVFDFDRTLIDTDALKQEQYRRVAVANSRSEKEIESGMISYIVSLKSHLDFSIEGYSSYLYTNFDIDPGTVVKVYLNNVAYIKDFVYPEVYATLAELKSHNIKMAIFSEAHPEHQKLKIAASGVLEYIEPSCVQIYQRKMLTKYVSKLPENAYVVDDGVHIVEDFAKNVPQVKPVWCNRKTKEKHPTIPTIFTLDEIIPLVIQSEK